MRGYRGGFGFCIVVPHVQTHGAAPFPLNTSSFQSFTRKAHVVFQKCSCVFVVTAAGTLLAHVPSELRKVRGSQVHGVVWSAPH